MTMIVFLFVLGVFTAASRGNAYINCSSSSALEGVAGKYSLRFLGFFPSCDLSSVGDNNECDMLTLSAVKLAIENINEDPDLLNCYDIELLPVYIKDPEQRPTDVFEILYQQQYNDLPIHGVIGPYHTDIAQMFAYVFGNYLPTLQISYSVTSTSLDNAMMYPHFHATVPTDEFFNRVINELLKHFGWRKVAILSSSDRQHVLVSQQLTNVLTRHDYMVEYLSAFITSAADILNFAKSNDTRIFIAIIEAKLGRSLLCQAYRANLTTADHVWILPGIYDPQWWSIGDQAMNSTEYNCTDEQMMEAINSTLFVDTLPTYLDGEFSQVELVLSNIFNKTEIIRDNSFSLSNTEFHQLLHSQALNAYDATRALALAWNVTLHNFTEDDLHVLLNQSWKVTAKSKQELVNRLQYNLENIISPYSGLAGWYLFDQSRSSYGAALITQFTGNTECILGWFQSYNGSVMETLQQCRFNECCNATWKGNYQPSDGYCPDGMCTCRFIETNTVAFFIFAIIIYIAGIFFSIAMQFVNFWWKKDKYFRSSSPILNVVVTLGCTLEYITGLMFMANYYIGITDTVALRPICNVTLWLFWLSLVIINATIFMKNWRIFRIFYNPTHKERKHLSNWSLAIGICLMILPVIVVLLAIVIFRPLSEYQASFPETCPNMSVGTGLTTFLVEDHCIEAISQYWDVIIAVYIFLLFIGILVLGCFNCRITSHYKKEGEMAILTGVISLLLFFMSYLLAFSLSNGNTTSSKIKNHMPYTVGSLWIYATYVITALYLPKAFAIVRDKAIRPRLRSRRSTVRRKFVELHDEIFYLKRHLKKISVDQGIPDNIKSTSTIATQMTELSDETPVTTPPAETKSVQFDI